MTGDEKGNALRPLSAIINVATISRSKPKADIAARSLACPRFSIALRVVPGRLQTLPGACTSKQVLWQLRTKTQMAVVLAGCH